MTRDFIALTYEAKTLKLRMIFNPDHDGQLVDSFLTAAPDEQRMMACVPRSHDPRLQKEFFGADDIAYIEKNATALIFRYGKWRR